MHNFSNNAKLNRRASSSAATNARIHAYKNVYVCVYFFLFNGGYLFVVLHFGSIVYLSVTPAFRMFIFICIHICMCMGMYAYVRVCVRVPCFRHFCTNINFRASVIRVYFHSSPQWVWHLRPQNFCHPYLYLQSLVSHWLSHFSGSQLLYGAWFRHTHTHIHITNIFVCVVVGVFNWALHIFRNSLSIYLIQPTWRRLSASLLLHSYTHAHIHKYIYA